MHLLLAHQILIGAAIALAAVFGVRSLVFFGRTGSMTELLLALGSGVVAVGLALYFRTVRARWLAAKKH